MTPITDTTDLCPPERCATSNLTATRDATGEYECGSDDLQRRARPRLVTIRRAAPSRMPITTFSPARQKAEAMWP